MAGFSSLSIRRTTTRRACDVFCLPDFEFGDLQQPARAESATPSCHPAATATCFSHFTARCVQATLLGKNDRLRFSSFRDPIDLKNLWSA